MFKLEENIGLDKNTMFRQTLTDKKFRGAIDGVIDESTMLAIAEKLGLSESQSVEERLSHSFCELCAFVGRWF